MPSETIGFIGLGDMGRPMAARLLQHGFTVVSCAHRRREAIESLQEQGLTEVENPREVGERADILMTIVLDAEQTDRVLRGPEGAMQALRPGSVIVVMSTLAPDYCRKLAAGAVEQEVAVVDCPVSGGSAGAEQGTLALMAGGKVEVIERCRAALEAMGTIVHCGDVGMGTMAKLANNAILAGNVGLLREARAVARSYGMDMDNFMKVLAHSSGNSFFVQHWNLLVTQWGHISSLLDKDADICLGAAQATGVAMPILEQYRERNWGESGPD